MDKTTKSSVWPTYNETGDIALKKQNTLRRLIGTLGMLLPILIYLFLQLTDNYHTIIPSISHYYYTRSGAIFEIVVSLLAIFLMIYKGEEPVDFILSGLAGISAILMLLFPTNNLRTFSPGEYTEIAITYIPGPENEARSIFHYVCAAFFLLSLASMSLFLFTRTHKDGSKKTGMKVFRNKIYIFCGVTMVLALATAFLGFLKIIPSEFYDTHKLTFWMEVVALEFFGVAWMVKGGVLFKD